MNQRAAEFSLCNTFVLLVDLAFKQPGRNELTTRCGSTESATILDMQVHIDGQNLTAKG